MKRDHEPSDSTSRRDVLRIAGLGAVTWGLGATGARTDAATSSAPGRPVGARVPATGPYNILFILTDQERYFRPGELPIGYSLPAHERLGKQGTTFVNHRINSCVCTPSRSVLYTGQHIQQTGMFDNTNFPWIKSMSPEIPTVGDMLRDAGYYTAYKGKWHLTKEFETVNTLGDPVADLHEGDGGLRLLRLLRHRRHHRPHAGRLPARRRHRRHGRELAARQGPRAGGRGQAVVPGGQPREPARRDVLRHRCAGSAGAAAARPLARGARPGRSAVCEAVGVRSCRRATSSRSTRPGDPRRITISCARTMPWSARSRTRNRAGAGGTTTT